MIYNLANKNKNDKKSSTTRIKQKNMGHTADVSPPVKQKNNSNDSVIYDTVLSNFKNDNQSSNCSYDDAACALRHSDISDGTGGGSDSGWGSIANGGSGPDGG